MLIIEKSDYLPPAANRAAPIAIIPVALYVLYNVSKTALPPKTDGKARLFMAPPSEAATSDVYRSTVALTHIEDEEEFCLFVNGNSHKAIWSEIMPFNAKNLNIEPN